MQVCCELCGCSFLMSANCKSKHPKCFYCRSGMDPEESRINHEMDECWEEVILAKTGTSYSEPDSDTVMSWAAKTEAKAELEYIEAEKFFYGTPSSDK